MLRVIYIIIFSFFASNSSFSSTTGSGEIKFSSLVIDGVLHYFDLNAVRDTRGNRKGVPSFFAVSKSGRNYGYTYCPSGQSCAMQPIQALQLCRKRSGERCYIFAKRRIIKWNQINFDVSRKATQSEVRDILREFGFIGSESTSKKSSIKPKITKKKEKKKKKVITKSESDDVVTKLKELNELYKDGALSKEEFDKAKKKLLD